MKNSKLFWFFYDFFLQMQLRLRLFVRNRMICAVIFLAAISFFLLIRDFNIQAQNRAAIPIGVVNEDQIDYMPTKASIQLLHGLSESSSLFVYEGTQKELEELLYDGYINCIFVIEQGYEKRLLSGETKELITVYEGQDDSLAMIISDIVAGEMMYQICLAKGIQIYQNIPPGEIGKHSYKEYQEYAKELLESEKFDYSFSITYVDTGQIVQEKKELNNSLLYRQILAGIAAMFYSFVILSVFYQIVKEKEQGLWIRRKLTKMQDMAQNLGDLCSAEVLLSGLSAIFSFCIAFYLDKMSIFFSLWLSSMFYNLVVGILFLLLARKIHQASLYQLIGISFVAVFGVAGFCTMIEEILIPKINLLHLIPNTWLIKRIGEQLLS